MLNIIPANQRARFCSASLSSVENVLKWEKDNEVELLGFWNLNRFGLLFANYSELCYTFLLYAAANLAFSSFHT